ncbi:MAG: hypothetical protein RLZZ200_1364 [Pseudomonadota bacterium]|jgi:signal transduction histidine kinase
MTPGPIPPSRLLRHIEDALLVVGADLVIRDVANLSAHALSAIAARGQTLVGEAVESTIAPLFAPFERPGFLSRLRVVLDPGHSGVTQNTVEGAAPVAVRAAGLTPFYEVTVRRYVDDGGSMLSVSIRDVSDRLQLRRALSLAREERDLALAVLRSEPDALHEYLRDSLETLTLVQSLQRLPARTTDPYRTKLRRIATELLQVAVGARKLGIELIAATAEGVISDLEDTAAHELPSGEEFLPIAAALDTLFRQLVAASHDMELRESSLQPPDQEPAAPRTPSDSDWPADVSVRLAERIESVSLERGSRATLTVSGLEQLPAFYHRSLEPLLFQLVDNAIQSGIEPTSEREAAGKSTIGHINVTCTVRPNGSYEVLVADDGQGLDVAEIRRKPGEAGNAGPGADIPFLQDLVMRMGGTIGVSTSKGRYTRLRIQLPPEALSPSA